MGDVISLDEYRERKKERSLEGRKGTVYATGSGEMFCRAIDWEEIKEEIEKWNSLMEGTKEEE